MTVSPLPLPAPVPLPGLDLVPAAWWLSPGVTLLWRGDGSFQLEHHDGGVVVSGLDRSVATALARPPREPEPGPTLAPDAVDLAALQRLAELGYVRAGGRPAGAVGRRPGGSPGVPDGMSNRIPGFVGRPGGDPAAGVVEPGSGADTGDVPRAGVGDTRDADAEDPAADPVDPSRRAARRSARVEVLGLTAVSAYVGSLLAAAGVGSVGFASTGVVRRRHLLPGGLTAADEGRRFAAAAADVVARAAPRTAVGPSDAEPDLVVVCLDAPVEPELRDLLQRTRRAHLAVHLDATRGEVGPLVLPGVSACLQCADLHRLDHDPAWTLLAVQLIARAGTGDPPDPDLAARTGALAASLALRWLDGDPVAGGALDGSHELRADRVAPRHRGRRPHPDCPCRAAWG